MACRSSSHSHPVNLQRIHKHLLGTRSFGSKSLSTELAGAETTPALTLGVAWRKYRAPLLAISLSVAITVGIVLCREKLLALRGYGYLGIFLISVLGNATVILPVPSLAVVFAGGGVFHPLLVGLFAGLGEPLGELTGYLAGYGGGVVIPEGPRFERIKGFMQRRGFLTLFVLSAIPNPVFDLAGLAAGILRYPVPKFLLACWLGKTVKAVVIACLGSLSYRALIPWIH